MQKRRSKGWFRGAIGACLVVGACQSAPEPAPDLGPYVAPAEMGAEQETYRGTILSRAQASEGGSTPQEGFAWSAELVLVERFAEPELASLSAQMALVAHPEKASPVLGAPILLLGGQWAAGEAAAQAWQDLQQGTWGRHGVLEEASGQLPAQHTTALRWNLTEEETDPDNFLQEWPKREAVTKRFTLALEASSQTLQPGFLLEDLGLERGDRDDQEVPPEGGRPSGPRMMSEWVLPAVTLPKDGEEVLFLLPNPFTTVGAEAIAVHLRAHRIGAAEFTEASETAEAPTRAEPLAPALATLAQLQPREGEAPRAELRGPLLYLANLSDAPLTSDLVLTASEEQLQRWIELVPSVEQLDEDTWMWALERAAWVHLARLQIKDQLPQEGRALLLLFGGEVGQYPSTIEAAALQSADLDTFARRLRAENLLFLDDSNPGARVRAFDWLAERGISVPGFDPLGPRDERRAALRAFEAQQEASNTSEAGQ